MGTILLIVLILLLLGALPVYPYSRRWGYAPTGTLSLLVVILIIPPAPGVCTGLDPRAMTPG